MSGEWVWAVVRGVAPVVIRLDGDTLDLEAEPVTLVDPATLAVGMRVYVHMRPGARPVLIGRSWPS